MPSARAQPSTSNHENQGDDEGQSSSQEHEVIVLDSDDDDLPNLSDADGDVFEDEEKHNDEESINWARWDREFRESILARREQLAIAQGVKDEPLSPSESPPTPQNKPPKSVQWWLPPPKKRYRDLDEHDWKQEMIALRFNCMRCGWLSNHFPKKAWYCAHKNCMFNVWCSVFFIQVTSF